MGNRYEVVTKFNHLGTYGAKVQTAAHDAIFTGITNIEARQKVNIVNNGQVDTGNMLNAAYSRMNGPLKGEAGNGAAYAAFQELGYKGIAGRPFLMPAFEATVPEVEAFLRVALNAP